MQSIEKVGQLRQYGDRLLALALHYAPTFLLALLTLVVGLWIIRGFTNLLRRVLSHKKLDVTLISFLANLLGWMFRVLLFISVASMIGIQTTSFVAILGAAGLAIGLALQGSLANFAGGMLILAFRPYKVGDLIESQGQLGVVSEIQIFTTTLVSPDNRRIVVPNGSLSNGIIKNHTAEGCMRVDLSVAIAYGAHIAKAKTALLAMLKEDARVLQAPAPVVAVGELADGGIRLFIRPSCRPEDYGSVYVETLEKTVSVLAREGIPLPVARRDVRMLKDAS